MSDEIKKLLENALALGEVDRALIAASLIESLDPEPETNIEEEWEQEIFRRIQELDSGSVKKIPWTEVRKQITAKTLAGRCQAFQKVVESTLEKIGRSRLTKECARLDKRFERQLADEGLSRALEKWPGY